MKAKWTRLLFDTSIQDDTGYIMGNEMLVGEKAGLCKYLAAGKHGRHDAKKAKSAGNRHSQNGKEDSAVLAATTRFAGATARLPIID